MNKIINKAASFYNMNQFKYSYQIGFYADVLSLVLLNIFGLLWILGPAFIGGMIVFNTPLNEYSIRLFFSDPFLGICLFNFFWYVFGQIFFIHNKTTISRYIGFFSLAWLAFGLFSIISNLAYIFLLENAKMVVAPNEHTTILYFDLSCLSVYILFRFFNSESFKNFIKNNLKPYQKNNQ